FLANWTVCVRRSAPCSAQNSVRDQRRDDDEDNHQRCGIARHQPEHDGKPADELHASADWREHRRDGSGYAVPCQTRRERVEFHEFLEAALNEDASDQDASEQPDGVAPSCGDSFDPRLIRTPQVHVIAVGWLGCAGHRSPSYSADESGMANFFRPSRARNKFSDQDRAACVLDQSELPSLAYPYGSTAVKHRANHAAKSAGGDMSWRTARCMRRTPQGSTSPA